MFKVTKPQGWNANISILNLDTNSSLIVGRLNLDILDIMKRSGYDVPASYHDEWDIEVNGECAQALANLTMKMKKPIRDQSKKTKAKQHNDAIDAMDVLLGLAKYN